MVTGSGELALLINSNNVTTNCGEMWTCSESSSVVTINLQEKREIGGLKIWNYNAGLEESYFGVKRMEVYMDGKLLSPSGGFLIRKAPGYAEFDFGQFLPLTHEINSGNGSGGGGGDAVVEVESGI
jgi:hypothetical protein